MRQSKFFKTLVASVAVFVMVSGAFAQTTPAPKYTITGSGTSFTADKYEGTTLTTNVQIQAVINAIITDEIQSATIQIQFGNGSDVLDIGTQMVFFGDGNSIVREIFLTGKITSARGMSGVGSPSGTIVIGSGITVQSSADIKNVAAGGNAIGVDGGQVKIIGGTVAVTNANGGNAIDFSFYSGDGGSVILSGSPTIAGNINVRAGALSVDPTFAPAGKQYTLAGMGAVGNVAVIGGATFASNFALVNSGNLGLAASGNDLVLAPMYTVIFNDYWSQNVIDSQTVAHGGKVQKPTDPTREGYTLKRWYLREECPTEPIPGGCIPNRTWDFDNDVVTRDIQLAIEWEKTTSIAAVNRANAAKPSGISVNGTSLRLVGTSQSTPLRIYNLNGKLLMSRSAMPNEVISVSNLARGTYVVKALGNSVRIVR
jgi:hypothetical protein